MNGAFAFDFSAPWVTTVLLLSLRLAAVFAMTPVLYAMPLPTTVRVLLLLTLAVALALGMPQAVPPAAGFGPLLASALAELALGATLGLGILLAFAAVSTAGHLIDVQVGFGIAQVLDPLTRRQLPLVTSAFNQLAVLLFLAVDGHHALLRGINYSLERFPLGGQLDVSLAWVPVLKQVSGLFGLGFALAAPVAFCLLMVELALGVVSRNLPQMNMFAIGVPVKIVVGLAALSLWLAGAGSVMNRVYASIYESWSQVFTAPLPAERVR